MLKRTYFLRCCGASALERAASMGAAFAWASARPGAGFFCVVHRLYKPRRETPRHEPSPLDDCGRFHSQRSRHQSLLRAATTAAEGLSTMLHFRADRIDLLPAVRYQAASELAQGPAGGSRD